MNHASNTSGQAPQRQLMCPVTGLRVSSRMEWTQQRVSDALAANFYVIGDSIIYSRPRGFADLEGVQRSLTLNQEVARSISGPNGKYIQIEDYAALDGLSQTARRYATDAMANNPRILALIFCNLSPLFSIAVKIGSRFNTPGKPIHVTSHYPSAIELAVDLGETSTHSPDAFVLGRQVSIDDSVNTLSPVDLITNDAWTIRTPMFSNKLVIIDGCMLHSTAKGHIAPEHIPLLETIRLSCQAALPPGSTIEYVIVNASHINRGHRQARIALLESLKKGDPRFQLKAYILYGANTFIRTAAILSRPFSPFRVDIVDDLDQALRLVAQYRKQAPRAARRALDAVKPEDSTRQRIEQLIAYIGGIKWDEAGVDTPIEIAEDDPFHILFQSIRLIKEEIDDLFSERKRLEAKLLESQKMEAIGTLAGGIAHDFNNLLMGIQGRSSLLSLRFGPSHPLMEHIAAIDGCVRSATHLTKQLLGFARGGKYEVRPIDINELLLESATMFGRTRKQIHLHTNLQNPPPVVAADRSQIEQVLLNLYINAWQAMPDGGDLYLETGTLTIDDVYYTPGQVKPGRYAKVSVTDTGTGMDASTRQRIFDPFFTTKKMGRGTGLGLASAYGIINNHEGVITVYSEVGHGTTFNIYLPLLDETVSTDPPRQTQLIKGSETILLVDDEEMITGVGKAMLEELGYRVLMATSGKQAVDLVRGNSHDIGLMILDLIMPGMDGGRTFDCIREINPSMPVILSSGYAMNNQADAIMQRGCNGFIQKPFNIYELSEGVRSVLDQGTKSVFSDSKS